MPWEEIAIRKMGLPAGTRAEWQIGQGLAVTGHRGFLAFTGTHVALRLDDGVLDIEGQGLFVDSMEQGVLLLGGDVELVAYRKTEHTEG